MVDRKTGIFICFEGLDGSGKTTQARHLVDYLTEQGYNAVYTREPSSGLFGEVIRKHVLRGDERVPTVVEAALFAADRLDHVRREIAPLLKEGRIVVCDRYVYSSIAYQGARGDVTSQWIERINEHALKPDLAIYIDVPAEIAVRRFKQKKSTMETLKTQRGVREIYGKLVKEKQLAPVDGNASIQEVAEAVQRLVVQLLESV
jgi:dTMP kinase